MSLYREDLAYIHHAGFSEFAETASIGVLEMLWKRGIREGLVVDIGCGSGVFARELTRAGLDVLGIDASPAMINLARETAPAARFAVGSLDTVEIPRCAAITAIGEVLNYSTLDGVRAFFARAAGALAPGGLMIFDLAEPGSYPPNDERQVGGDDWSVIAIKESAGDRLTRRVLTFREIDGDVRRTEEVHELELYDRGTILAELRAKGLRARVRRSYGSRRLPPGHFVYFVAQPSRIT